MPRWLRIGVVVVILTIVVLWVGDVALAPRIQVAPSATAAAQGAPAPTISASPAPALTTAPPATLPAAPAPPTIAPAQATVAAPPQPQAAPPASPPPQYETVATPTVRTLFIALPDTPETLTWPDAPGSSVQCQWSLDGAQWYGQPVSVVGADGLAHCSFTPTQTAYYRAYLPETGAYGETVRGLITQKPGWSGYVVGNGPYTFVKGTFTVPALPPSATRTDIAEWVGIGGYYGTDPLIQAGVWETYDPTAAPALQVYAWWEVLPTEAAQSIDLSVAVGDTVSVTIWQEQGTQWAILITDGSTAYPMIQASYSGPGSSADWIVEAPVSGTTGAQLAFGHYTPQVTFSHIGFLGSDTVAYPLRIVTTAGGVPLSVPSDLSSDGRSFNLAYGGATPPTP